MGFDQIGMLDSKVVKYLFGVKVKDYKLANPSGYNAETTEFILAKPLLIVIGGSTILLETRPRDSGYFWADWIGVTEEWNH